MSETKSRSGRKPASVTILGMHGGRRTVRAPKCPKPPKVLRGEALREWRRIAPLLWKHEFVTEADLPELAIYCELWSDLSECWEQIHALKSPIVKGPRGAQKVHPLYRRQTQLARQVLRLGNKFGMSPLSRARMQRAKGRRPEPPSQ